MLFSILLSIPANFFWWLRGQNKKVLAIQAAFIIAIFFNFGGDYYAGKWTGFLFSALILVSFATYQRYGLFAALNVGWIFLSATYVTVFPHNMYEHTTPYDLLALKFFSSEAALKFALILATFLLYEPPAWVGKLACVFLIGSLLESFWEWAFHGCAEINTCGGILGNPSLNCGMLVCALPFCFHYATKAGVGWLKWGLALGVGIAAALGRSNAGLGMLAAFLMIHLASRLNPIRLLALMAMPIAFALLGKAILGVKFLQSGLRVHAWQYFMGQWAHIPIYRVMGTGFGTFGIFSRHLQNIREGEFNVDWWLWMHNDWLETFFTGGVIGGVLLIALYLVALWGLWEKRLHPELQSLLLFGVYASVNFPLHVGLTAAFGGWLLTRGLYKNPALHSEIVPSY